MYKWIITHGHTQFLVGYEAIGGYKTCSIAFRRNKILELPVFRRDEIKTLSRFFP